MLLRYPLAVFFCVLAVFSGCSRKAKAPAAAPQKVQEASLGVYVYENEASEPVKKEAVLRPWKKDDQLRLSINVTWTPGRTVEIEHAMPYTNPSQMEFEFADNFGNKGEAQMERQEDGGILLTLTPTEINDRRAVMQYGAFKLMRK
ncbi:MAG: hypothetical protein V1746_08560 [bacterium]